jgi:predicted nuclease with RNAse H fold
VRALGIDVAVRKGLDIVVLSEWLQTESVKRRVSLAQIGDLILEIQPDIVAIDSPPSWAQSGRSRATERTLARLGIHAYAVPTEASGRGHSFYAWMESGFAVFLAAERAGYPRFRRRGSPTHTAIEVFPHGSAVVLAGHLPPASANAGSGKRQWRISVLESQGVATDGLRSVDEVDAALAALTGLFALRGEYIAPGDPDEGVIVLPSRVLPDGRYERSASAVRERTRERTA